MSDEDRNAAQDGSFGDWRSQCTPAEWKLWETAIEFEEKYFADLRLLAPSIRRQLLRHEVKMDGRWVPTEADPPYVTIDDWSFWIREMEGQREGCLGWCDCDTKCMIIAPDLRGKDLRGTLLHEMIHAYLFQLPDGLREWLTVNLYVRLSRRMPPRKLHRYINTSNHSVFHLPWHGVLFLLKSLDLDMRLKWKPGTVFGYGREDYFG